MKDTLTPKQVSRAIDVSESSVKRWCDNGTIPAQYTAGGHRRIPLSGLMAYLRTSKHRLVRPEILGLPSTTGQTDRVLQRALHQYTEALLQGDADQCRRIVFDLYLAEHSLSNICDEVLAAAFVAIGDRWECGDAEVYQERRGCEITLRILHELPSFLTTPEPESPAAIGGAPAGDQYAVATTMVELVLREQGWNAVSLGDNLPFATLEAAIKEHRPRLFWLSCSHLEDETQFLIDYEQLYDELGTSVAFVVGGRALTEQVRQRMKYGAFCDNMLHLESFAQTLFPKGS